MLFENFNCNLGECNLILFIQTRIDLFVNLFFLYFICICICSQTYVVDNGHLVAWAVDSAKGGNFEIKLASKGVFSTMKTGEGMVCHFTGPAVVYLATRNIQELARSLIPYLPQN